MNWKRLLLRLTPLLVLALFTLMAFLFDLDEYFTFDQLKHHREQLLAVVADHPIASPLIFILIYTVVVALSLPGATLLTLTSGFLFYQPWCTLWAVVGATIGASLIFVVARSAIGAFLREKAAPFLNRMKEGFNNDAASYLLFLRFIPLFPFWLVNIAPAFFHVRFTTYLWTTFVGIIPGSYVYAQAGRGLGAIFDKGEQFSFDAVFNIQVRIALIALAIFSLIPIVIKRFRHD